MINIKEFFGLAFYVSALDQFLKAFDSSHPTLSASQLKEMAKSDRIANLRDNPETTDTHTSFWDKF